MKNFWSNLCGILLIALFITSIITVWAYEYFSWWKILATEAILLIYSLV